VLFLLGGGAWFLLSSDGDGGPNAGSTSASTSTDVSASAVNIDLAAYVGRNADEVQAELEGLGFSVTQADASEQTISDGAALADRPLAVGEVADIQPSGENVPTTAALTIYAVPEAVPDGGEETETQTSESTSSSPETTSSAPTTTTEETTTTSSVPTTTAETTLPGTTPPTTEVPPTTTAGETVAEGAGTDGTG